MNVEVRHLIDGKSISFMGESIFEPIFNMNVTSAPSTQGSEVTSPKQRSKLSLQIYYQRNSLLFQVDKHLSVISIITLKIRLNLISIMLGFEVIFFYFSIPSLQC